jgi:hypothetical protein
MPRDLAFCRMIVDAEEAPVGQPLLRQGLGQGLTIDKMR